MLPNNNPKKKQRVGSHSRLSSLTTTTTSPSSDNSLAGALPESSLLRPSPSGFNDPLTSDVLLHLHLHLHLDPSVTTSSHSHTHSYSSIDLHLHSSALRRSNYFSTLLSDRWLPNLTTNSPDNKNVDKEDDDDDDDDDDDRHQRIVRLSLETPPSSSSLEPHIAALQLLYSHDLSSSIDSPSTAISLLPVGLHLLFDDLVSACVGFLEAVPWSLEEEQSILHLIPLLPPHHSRLLLDRLSPSTPDSSEAMLHRLLAASIGNHPSFSSAKVKSFVAKFLGEFPHRDSVRRVFDRAFRTTLRTVRDSLEKYSSPDFRGDHDETEAIQRLNLHTAVYHGKDLLWLLERMIELRVADSAVAEWSEQTAFVADLQRAFQDDAWRNIAPGLPALVLRCTGRLAGAVAAGSILAARQVRLRLVSVWLPVLIVCREKNVSPIPSGQKQLYQELEETFLKIISTLPMSEAEQLLHHCLSFATRDVEDCPHLVSAFNTWFRRATCPPPDDIAS